jgi:hypothetical protein
MRSNSSKGSSSMGAATRTVDRTSPHCSSPSVVLLVEFPASPPSISSQAAIKEAVYCQDRERNAKVRIQALQPTIFTLRIESMYVRRSAMRSTVDLMEYLQVESSGVETEPRLWSCRRSCTSNMAANARLPNDNSTSSVAALLLLPTTTPECDCHSNCRRSSGVSLSTGNNGHMANCSNSILTVAVLRQMVKSSWAIQSGL